MQSVHHVVQSLCLFAVIAGGLAYSRARRTTAFSASGMRSGSVISSISESAALYSCLQYLLSGDLEIPVLINASPRFRMLVKCCGFKTKKCRDWFQAMMPDVYRHRSQHWSRNGFPNKAKDHVPDQKCE